jgi:hypothetical protein
MSIYRFRNTIGGARVTPDCKNAGGLWNLSEAAMYTSFYSNTVPSWPPQIAKTIFSLAEPITLDLYYDAALPESYPGTGTTWTDLSGNGYTGTLNNGPTFSSDNGGGIVFDGSNDGVSTTYTANTGNTFTLAFWCKPTAIGQANGSDLGGKGYAATAPFASYAIDYLSTSKFRYIVADNLTFNSATGSNTCSINNIYYVVLVYNGPIATGYINIDGVMTQDATFINTNNPAYNSQAFNIGYNPLSLANNYFTGTIFVCQLYSTALTLSRVQQNFDAMRGRFAL